MEKETFQIKKQTTIKAIENIKIERLGSPDASPVNLKRDESVISRDISEEETRN
jgi:hypothetical protein